MQTVIENKDGSSKYIFETDEETKAQIMKVTGMTEWDDDKFNEFVVFALDNYIK